RRHTRFSRDWSSDVCSSDLKTTEIAPFQDTEINQVTPPPAAPPEVTRDAPKAALATRAPRPEKTPVQAEQQKVEKQRPAPEFDTIGRASCRERERECQRAVG